MISLIVRGIFSINWVKLYSCLSDQINLLIKKYEDDIGIRMRTFISQSKYFQRLILSLICKIPIISILEERLLVLDQIMTLQSMMKNLATRSGFV